MWCDFSVAFLHFARGGSSDSCKSHTHVQHQQLKIENVMKTVSALHEDTQKSLICHKTVCVGKSL